MKKIQDISQPFFFVMSLAHSQRPRFLLQSKSKGDSVTGIGCRSCIHVG